MANFTTVASGTDWASVSFINEIMQALEERERAVSPVADTDYQVAVGDDIQSSTFWATRQTAVENVAPWYCDPDIDPGTFTEDGIDFEGPGYNAHNWTIGEWRLYAGIHASGFRRATTMPADWTDLDDPAYSYGHMQTGDIIGPWILVDLQRGLGALTTSIDAAYYAMWISPTSGKRKSAASYGQATIAAALAQQITFWNVASWDDSSSGTYGQMYCWWDYGSNNYVRAWTTSGLLSMTLPVAVDTACEISQWDLVNGTHGFGFCGGAGAVLQTVSRGQVFSGTASKGDKLTATDIFRDSGNPAVLSSDPGYDQSYILTDQCGIFKIIWGFTMQ